MNRAVFSVADELRPRLGGLLNFNTFTFQNATSADKVPYLTDLATCLSGLPTYLINMIK